MPFVPNIRQKFFFENRQLCLDNISLLTDWEKQFVNSLRGSYDPTQRMFNKMLDVADNVKQRLQKSVST